MQVERRGGLMTRAEDVEDRTEAEEERELVQQASACSANIINPLINSCLLMYLFTSPLPVEVMAPTRHSD